MTDPNSTSHVVVSQGGLKELTNAEWADMIVQRDARWKDAATKAKDLLEGLTADEVWALRQQLAGDGRYYGDGGTIHSAGSLDIDMVDGEVVAVWFRCLLLPFNVVRDRSSAPQDVVGQGAAITGIEYRETEAVPA